MGSTLLYSLATLNHSKGVPWLENNAQLFFGPCGPLCAFNVESTVELGQMLKKADQLA